MSGNEFGWSVWAINIKEWRHRQTRPRPKYRIFDDTAFDAVLCYIQTVCCRFTDETHKKPVVTSYVNTHIFSCCSNEKWQKMEWKRKKRKARWRTLDAPSLGALSPPWSRTSNKTSRLCRLLQDPDARRAIKEQFESDFAAPMRLFHTPFDVVKRRIRPVGGAQRVPLPQLYSTLELKTRDHPLLSLTCAHEHAQEERMELTDLPHIWSKLQPAATTSNTQNVRTSSV